MKGIKNYLQYNNWKEVFFKSSTYFFVGTLPLFLNLNTIALWCLVLSSILTIRSHDGILNLKRNISGLMPIFLLFLLFVIGLLLSKDTNRSLVDIGRTVPLLLIPAVVFLHKKKDFDIRRLFIALGIGLSIGMLICWYAIFVSILSKTYPIKQASYFFEWIYTDINLVKPLGVHPSYFAILLVLFISALLFDNHFKNLRQNKIFFFLLLVPFAVFLIETSSRIGILVLLTIICVYVIKNLNFKSLASLVLLILVIAALSLKFDYLGLKFQKIINSKGEITVERLGRWKEILKVFNEKDKLLLGVGSGDAKLVYQRAYYNGRYDLAFKENYNAHNQYLEFLVSNGIIGLIIYLSVFYVFIKQTQLKSKSLHFFIAFILFSFSETFLDRSQGVMIFSFFYAFLIVYYKPLEILKHAKD
jgi:O-antigen ligase